MIDLHEFSMKVTAARASRAAAQAVPAAPAQPSAHAPAAQSRAAHAAAVPPRATSWSEIADIVNAQAGLTRGANITPTAATRDPSRPRTAPPKAGAVDWGAIAAIVNAEAGVTPNRSTGAP